MNYTQNRKIAQITEQTLIVGIDIAKHRQVARAQDFRGMDLSKRLVFANNLEGFQGLLQWVKALMSQHQKSEVVIGMEPTGHYWMTLAYYLKAQDIRCVLVNPMHVKKSKELDDNSPTKNDTKDAKVIAQLIKDGRYSEPTLPEETYAELREGMKLYDQLVQDQTRIKAKVHNWLDRYFPEFLTVFKSWEGKAALQVLRQCYLPQEITTIPDETLLLEIKKVAQRAIGLKRVRQLKAVAEQSVGLTVGTRFAKEECRFLTEKYDDLTERLHELTEELCALVLTIPGAKEMSEIKGIGLITVVGFFAEVGDLSQYDHPRQILKLAGLNLRMNASGKHKGKTTITKRGRKRLRALLFRVAMPLAATNEAFKGLHHYYRHRPIHPLTGKQSLIALCHKLIRVLFVIGRRQCAFSEKQMMQDMPHLQHTQGVA
ncbi:IS110 family transposase [Sporolactobacillus sp. CQH2019]|uniref:IS110 family transposase n=1 Tax=Sporolactobacillus sp. CQH2019 TaxID=3023512 RepID=UPI002368CE8B|nr:IS110 family transposase [Sporolactobacillus sp. CQH2019]MDD9150925.1 IS110 family transposase [Sporolactobacillus sp. CQH2019]